MNGNTITLRDLLKIKTHVEDAAFVLGLILEKAESGTISPEAAASSVNVTLASLNHLSRLDTATTK